MMGAKEKNINQTCQLWGWALFIISALFYGWASFRSGDILGFLGSLFFLVACLIFLIPFFVKPGNGKDHQTDA